MFDHFFARLGRWSGRCTTGTRCRRSLKIEVLESRTMLSDGLVDPALPDTRSDQPEGEPVSERRQPIKLTGALPRRVRIVDPKTAEAVYDHWQYQSEFDISFLPAGQYDLNHAASGEKWEPAELVTGVQLPSGRILAERVDQDTFEFDWGRLSDPPSFRVVVTQAQGQQTLFDAWHYHETLSLHVSEGAVKLQIAIPSRSFQTVTFGVIEPVIDITLPNELPRRVQIVDAFRSRVVFDDWHYSTSLDISWLPAGRYQVRHASSGEAWVVGQLYTKVPLPSQRVFLQRIGNELEIDWGRLGDYPSVFVNVVEEDATLFNAWHYHPTLRLAVGSSATIQIALPSQKFQTFHVGVPLIYDLPPLEFDTRLIPPPGMAERSDLRHLGQYQFVAVGDFTRRIGCEHDLRGAVHQITCDGQTVEWRSGHKDFASLGENHPVELPQVPFVEDGELFFPLRILAEKLGFNTRFDPATNIVTVFRLGDALRTVPLRLDRTISGSDLSFSYFNTVHETSRHIFLTFDHSSSIVRYDKPDFTYTLLTAPAEYGSLGEFVVTSAGVLYVATSHGLLLKWADGAFTVVGGAGDEELNRTGGQLMLARLKTYAIAEMVLRDDRTLFFHAEGHLYQADLLAGTVTQIWYGDLLDLDVYRGEPLVIPQRGSPLWLNSKDHTGQRSQCFDRLFNADASNPHQIHGVRYFPAHDLFVVISAARRAVYEVQMSFDNESGDRPCSILRSTNLGGSTAFLSGIGTRDPALSADDQVLLVDGDGFNLVQYSLGGSYSLITKDKLGSHANTTFVAPITVAEDGGNLYVVANSSHQIVRYSLLDGTLERFVGTGTPLRNAATNVGRLDISLGYPNEARFIEGRLLIADHLNRRILAVEGDKVRQLFGPTDWWTISGINGFDGRKGELYFADPASGGIYRWRVGDAQPVHFAGYINPDWLTGSTAVRRQEAAKSAQEMTTLDTVSFGLPRSVAMLGDGRIVVTDLYRSGLWLLSTDGSVERLAGMNADTNYHYGAFTGNAGLESDELRIGTPVMVTYDPQRKILLVAGGFSRTVAFIRDDFSKTCVATMDLPLEYVSQARFLSDGRLAVVDTPRNAVHLFQPPNLSCLSTRTDVP